MKITEYATYDQNRAFLFEGLDSQTITEAKDWERILRPIVEAQLTPDQINNLFQQAQQVATAGGANRTGIGKGVDATRAAGEAFEKVKAAMQNSGPIQGFEAQYDKIAAKLKEKTGGDQGVMQYIQKYRDFATKHPVAQKVIYAAAIAALGALAVGGSIAAVSGGPVVLGLFKMTDRLLQGDKLTSAAWQGAKVAGGAAAAVGLGKTIRGALGFGAPTSTSLTSKIVNRPDDFGPTGAQPQGGGKIAGSASDAAANLTPGQMARNGLQQLKDMVAKGEITDYNSYTKAINTVTNNSGASGVGKTMVRSQIELLANHSTGLKSGSGPEFVKKFIELNGGTPNAQSLATATADASNAQSQMDQSAARMRQATGSASADNASSGSAPIEPGANTSAAVNNSVKQALANISTKADIGVAAQTASNTLKDMVKQGLITDRWSYDQAYRELSNGIGDKFGGGSWKTATDVAMRSQRLPLGNDIEKWIKSNGGTPGPSGVSAEIKARLADPEYQAARAARQAKYGYSDESAYESRLREELAIKRKLPKSQIIEMFHQVDEGIWDTVKKGAGAAVGAVASGAKAVAGSRIGQAVGATAKDAAGAVAQKVGTTATNLTTKVTADKLTKAWKAAGSPTDSAEVYKIMKAQGLDDTTLNNIFKAAKIPLAPAQGAGFNVKLPQKPAATPTAAPAPQPTAPAVAPGQQKDDWKARRDAQWKKKQDAAKGIHHITKPGTKINEEPVDDVPLNKSAINKILMSIAQAGAGGGSPQQQQEPAAGQQAPAQNTSARSASRRQASPQAQQSDEEPQASAGGTQAAPVQSGPDVPLNKAAINKILMSVAQASS